MRAMSDEPERPPLTMIRGGKASPGPTRARLNLDGAPVRVRVEIAPDGRMGVVVGFDHPRAFLTWALTPEGAHQMGEQMVSAAYAAGWEP